MRYAWLVCLLIVGAGCGGARGEGGALEFVSETCEASQCVFAYTLQMDGSVERIDSYHPLEVSPDGRFIAIRYPRPADAIDEDEGGAGFMLYSLDAGVNHRRQLVGVGATLGEFAWSPDGSRLALSYVREDEPGVRDGYVGVYDVAAGSFDMVAADNVSVCGAVCSVFDPVWSRDGSVFAVIESDYGRVGSWENVRIGVFYPSPLERVRVVSAAFPPASAGCEWCAHPYWPEDGGEVRLSSGIELF